MKVISYVGAEGDCIVINSPRDIYPLLDWLSSQLMDLSDEDGDEFEEAADYVAVLMDQVEGDGKGNFDDVDNTEYR